VNKAGGASSSTASMASATPPPPKAATPRPPTSNGGTPGPFAMGVGAPPPPPPLVSANSAPPIVTGGPMAFAAPMSRNASQASYMGLPSKGPPSLAGSTGPPSGPPSRPTTSMGVANGGAADIDDLLGPAAPRSRTGGAKAKRKGRYVDVFPKGS
jgi:COPII coat assembly protein SEC16